MSTVGAAEAADRWDELLHRVAAGEEFTIVRQGQPVARLVPTRQDEAEVARTIAAMLKLRDESGPTLGPDVTIKDLMEAGRR